MRNNFVRNRRGSQHYLAQRFCRRVAFAWDGLAIVAGNLRKARAAVADDDTAFALLVPVQPVSRLHAKLFLLLLVGAYDLFRLILPSPLIHLLVRVGQVFALPLEIGRQLCLVLLGLSLGLLCIQHGGASGIPCDLIGLARREVLGKSIPGKHCDDQTRHGGTYLPGQRHSH
jgi:hypothetical protein